MPHFLCHIFYIFYITFLISHFLFQASGVAGKSKDRFRVRQKQQGYPHALKPLYATVSCQFLRPRVRAAPFCERARCAMKTQQRNTKHAPFDVWDASDALLRKPQKRRSIFRDKKADEKTCKKAGDTKPPAFEIHIKRIQRYRRCSHMSC